MYFVHALYCEGITEPFKDLLRFLHHHPKEFVILDFQHFYDFQAQHHHELIRIIMRFFKALLFPRSTDESNLKLLTLTNCFESRKQILIIYRNSSFASDDFFRSYDFPTPWPNATKIELLKETLEKRITQRSPHQGYVTQCILTPDAKFILPRFYSTLRKKCAKKVESQLINWVKDQSPGRFEEGEKPRSNVFIADFVDLNNNNFSKSVIDLNLKLVMLEENESIN